MTALRRRASVLLVALLAATASGQTSRPATPATTAATTAPATRPAVLRVACVGDSITAGAGTRDRATESYPARLQRLLGPRYDVRNFGVSGATALNAGDKPYAATDACQEALAFRPDVVVLMLGTNDSKHPIEGDDATARVPHNWDHKADFAADYAALLRAFAAANPQARLYAADPVPAFPGRFGIDGRIVHEEVAPLVARAAATVPATTVLDLYTPLAGSADLFPDTVHPNAAGAEKLAEAVYAGVTGHAAPKVADTKVDLLLNRRVLVLGDSITQAGHYVTFVEYYLARLYPQARVDVVSIGLASETVAGLSEAEHPFQRPCLLDRLQNALDAVRPATVVLCYGMNDGVYAPADPARTAAFRSGLLTTLRTVRLASADAIVCTPPPFDPLPVAANTQPATAPDFSYKHPFAGYDATLAGYADWERSLSPGEARAIVDFHTPLLAALQARRRTDPGFHFAKDGIHPSPAGHLLMARTLLASLGVDLPPVADLDAELRRIEADPIYPLVRRQREARSAGWLDYVGYTRGKTVKADSVDAVEREDQALGQQIATLLGKTP